MTALASLPMYDAPRGARVAFWGAVRTRLAQAGVDAPGELTELTDLDAHWRSPDLLFSQTCGLPLSTTLRDDAILLGTPHYAAPGCKGPLYSSVLVAREDDPAQEPSALRGRRAVVNDWGSHSGCSQLFGTVAPGERRDGVFESVRVSGSHLRSLAWVRSGEADVAAIDCVTFALASRDRPETVEGLRIVGRSTLAPGLPFIASNRWPPAVVDALRESLAAVIEDPDLADIRATLLISGFSLLPREAYDVCRRAATSAPAPAPAGA